MIDVDVTRYTDAKLKAHIKSTDYDIELLEIGQPCRVTTDHLYSMREFRARLEIERNRRGIGLPLFAQSSEVTQ